MRHFERIRCPNCGSYGERDCVPGTSLIRTQCQACDYLLITCEMSERVIESYAPGLNVTSKLHL